MTDEVINFNFGDVEPATPSMFTLIPSGEYQFQCVGLRKYNTGEAKDPKGVGDVSKPNLEFKLQIINHTMYQGTELKLSHSVTDPKSRGFLLNTLLCLMPGPNWQRDGIQIPLSQLIQQVQGKTTNGVVFHDSFKGTDGDTVYVAKIKGLKNFDPTVPPPMPTEDNPPKYMLEKRPAPAIQQQAAHGVSEADKANFLNQWPGGTAPVPAPASAGNSESVLDFGF